VIDDALSYVSTSSLLGCVSITSFNETSACVLRKARDVALHIPGYKALRVVLGRDPITGDHIERNGRNFIEAAFDIMPGGELLHRKLDEQHQLDAAAEWIDGKIADLESIVNDLFSRFDQFWNGLEMDDLTSPMDVIREGAGIVLGFIDNIITFAVSAALELLEMVKEFLLDKIVEFIKEHTTAYPLLTVILGEDPVTKQKVDRNGTNILNALLELGGEEGRMQRDQMMETGTFQKVVAYIDEGIAVFSDLYNTIIQNFSNIWNFVSIDALMDPFDTFTRIYNIFAEPVTRVLDFVKRVVAEILKLVKDVLFKRISAEAKKVRGYYLVTVLISKDPFTGERVPRSVENIIHGFMSLMDGGEEQFQQMKESGAIDKAVGKINAAVKRLNMTFESVVQLFIDLWNSFTFSDFLHPIETFQRIIAKFGEPIGRLIAFVVEIVKIIVEVILIIMNFPFDLINNIIAKAMQAFDLIKRDPIGFLKNLLRAIKEGFMQFFDNILTHLFNGLKTWFLGEVQAAGIPIPTDFTVMGIIKWLLAVLDVTMEKIWKKLEERIGKPKVDKIKKMIDTAERVANAAGEAYAFMQDVQQRGFMAVMIDKVKEQLSNVWEMVLDAVKGFVMDQIIKKVTTKLLSMLDPTGIMAVVNSAIALYKAIQSFIKYLRQMLEIVNSFVEGTLQIAQGATKKAADFLEGALARGIPIVIGFLANQVGLNLSERLKDALEVVREKVDKALTWVIDKLVVIVEKIVSFGKAAVGKVLSWLGLRKEFTMENGDKHTLSLAKSGSSGQLMIESTPMPLLTFINQFAAQPGLPAAKIQAANDARTYATTEVMPILNQVNTAPEGTDTTALEQQLLEKMVQLTNKIRLLVGEAELLGNHVDKYLLEGAAGTFASMPKPVRDDMTADHIPQNALFQVVMGLGLFSTGSPMDKHAERRTDDGYAMNEQDARHKAGRTWGPKGTVTKANFRDRANAIMAGTGKPNEKKNAIVEEIKKDKNDDITKTTSVYAQSIDDPVWSDVKNLPLKQEDKISLQTTIRNQATAGLALLNSQNLDALKV
jgi:phage-related protein